MMRGCNFLPLGINTQSIKYINEVFGTQDLFHLIIKCIVFPKTFNSDNG